MHYECKHGKKLVPVNEAARFIEACPICEKAGRKYNYERRQWEVVVPYKPVFAPGEDRDVETQLKATLLFHLKWRDGEPGAWG